MTTRDEALVERIALLRSIAATAVLGALGVAWGVATGSQMILLDGVYAVVGILVSWLLLRASALVSEGPSRAYPFGREAVTPMVVGVQGFVLLATLLYAAVEAGFTIRDGGSDIAAGWAIVYGVIATAGSAVVWWWLARVAGYSDLLLAEATAWRVGAMRGVGMVVGFGIMAALAGTAWDGAAPYVDPAMVLLTCVLFVAPPVAMVRSTVLELLEREPPRSVRDPVLAAVAAVRAQYDLDEPEVRIAKVGAKIYVEVEGHVAPDVTVAQEHAVRLDLQRRLDELPYDAWLNVELTPRPPSV